MKKQFNELDKKKEEIPDTDSFSDSIDAGIPAATEEAGE